jgi:exopolysaccharide biosynthesis WecB/TagA/CpsF family protein
MPLIWASRLQGTPLPQRIAGSDLISSLSATAATRGRSVFLLGGAPGTADKAAVVLKTATPSLNIVGTHCPPIGFESSDAELKKIVIALKQTKPDIIFVALGSPKQEYLIQRFRQLLPGSWWLGVGISFSFLCGEVKRAPRWLQKIGLEWMHRLAQDPRRLFHRYVVVGIPFGLSMLGRAIVRGVPQRIRGEQPVPEALPITVPATQPAPLPVPNLVPSNGNGNGDGAAEATPTAPAPQPRRKRAAATATTAGGLHVGNLTRLRAMVLLGGSVRSSPLIAACDRSLLDLPLDIDGSIFNHWLAQAGELARYAGLESLPVRVMVNRNAPEPISAAPSYYGKFRVERDLSEYRGTGGVLRDLAAGYEDDDLILVCNAAQILMDPLAAIATALDKKEGDVTLVAHNDGTPSGVQLIRCGTLRMIPEMGFVDMKEQALALIATKHDVTVLHCRRPTALQVRSLADYIVAMRHYHRRRIGRPAVSDPLAEDWQPAFAIVEQGASVDPRAHVNDAVVLKGGVVEAGAVVVRSIVCPGGVVKKDRPAVDQLVSVGLS